MNRPCVTPYAVDPIALLSEAFRCRSARRQHRGDGVSEIRIRSIPPVFCEETGAAN